MKPNVVIIGAGASGLYAAYCLVTRGLTENIIVLEAEDRVGGRIHSIPFNGHWLELGATWIHGRGENLLWKFVEKKQIPISDRPNRDGEGIFIRDDGKEMPKDIFEETSEFLWTVHEDANKFAKVTEVEDAPKSIGHYFEKRFNDWLKEMGDESQEVQDWRKQYYNWFIKYEEGDTGCDNLFQHSSISWGEYIDYDVETNFAQGYKSVIDCFMKHLGNKVEIKTSHKGIEIK